MVALFKRERFRLTFRKVFVLLYERGASRALQCLHLHIVTSVIGLVFVLRYSGPFYDGVNYGALGFC